MTIVFRSIESRASKDLLRLVVNPLAENFNRKCTLAQRISFALGTRSLTIIWAHRWTDLLSHRCVCFSYSLDFIFILSQNIQLFILWNDTLLHHSICQVATDNVPSIVHVAITHMTVCFALSVFFFSQRISTYALLWCPPLSGGSYGLSICTSPITNDGVFLYVPLDLFCFISENPVSLLLLFINWIRPLWFPLQHVSGEANRHLSKSNIYGIYQRKMFRCLIACSGSVFDVIWMST